MIYVLLLLLVLSNTTYGEYLERSEFTTYGSTHLILQSAPSDFKVFKPHVWIIHDIVSGKIDFIDVSSILQLVSSENKSVTDEDAFYAAVFDIMKAEKLLERYPIQIHPRLQIIDYRIVKARLTKEQCIKVLNALVDDNSLIIKVNIFGEDIHPYFVFSFGGELECIALNLIAYKNPKNLVLQLKKAFEVVELKENMRAVFVMKKLEK